MRRWFTRRVANWVVLGVGAALAELALLRVLYEGFHIALPVATALAAEVLILIKFLIADRWVFGHLAPTFDRLLKYHGACAGALLVYWVIINALTSVTGIAYEVAFVLGTVASFAWSLLTNFLWVWRRAA